MLYYAQNSTRETEKVLGGVQYAQGFQIDHLLLFVSFLLYLYSLLLVFYNLVRGLSISKKVLEKKT